MNCMIKKTKAIYLFWIFVLISTSLISQVSFNYQEAADPHADKNAKWDQIPKGLHASFANPLLKFAKGAIPILPTQEIWNVQGWKGERVFTQIILWSADSIHKIECKFSNFVSTSSNKLPGSIARSQFVRNVLTDEFGGGCDKRKPEDFQVSLVSDVLDNSNSISLSPQTSRPVWVTIDIPFDAKPGMYNAALTLQINSKIFTTFNIAMEVIDQQLPAPADWKFYLDMWQNPYAVARYHKVEPWSIKHWQLLKPLMQMLANAGQKTITATINKRPWGTQTEDPYESMVTWVKKTNGTWAYDYSIFDKWVNFMMGLGIQKQINCYSMVPWGNEFYYLDEKKNKEIKIEAIPGSPEYINLLTPFLKSFKDHLVKKGWNNIARLAMDERQPEQMKAMLNLVNKIAPAFGISLADDHKSYKLYPDQLKDLSISFGNTIEEADLKYRKKNKMISTFYVSCMHAFPNIHTFSSPSEAVFIPWYAMAVNLDGFLYWAYNNWVLNPLVDSRFRTWPAGDTYIVYPDARSSIRFEMLRDGIEDAEKIRILRMKFIDNNQTEKLRMLNDLVASFKVKERPVQLDEMIQSAQKQLNNLSK